MTDFVRFNNGANFPPHLKLNHSLWALRGLPMNEKTEWTLQEKFMRVKVHGFTAVECFLNDENEQEVCETLRVNGLHLVLGHRPYTLDDVRKAVERAVRREAWFIFAQPADAFTPVEEVAKLCREGRKIANDHGLPFFVETHRSNYTENLPQILKLIDLVPDIRFTADLSHLVLVGEFYGWKEEKAIQRLLPILERTSHIHGRVSNGEAIQVDAGDGEGETAKFFVKLWAMAMHYWLQGAKTGDIFPFASELGPPRYAITLPNGKEFSDRWEQSFVMKMLAEEAWELAQVGVSSAIEEIVC